MEEKVTVLGLMSGTSLDGLDIAACSFWRKNEVWKYEILKAQTEAYPKEWEARLKSAHHLHEEALQILSNQYGSYLAERCNDFMEQHRIRPDFIASHGHTVLHQPEVGITLQIGDGAAIAQGTGLKIVSNFRQGDVALGGQGAPLVPIGDQLLFGQFDACLNLGGIANISYEHNNKRIAFDICPVNLLLNPLAELLGSTYDTDGNFARTGQINRELLQSLNDIPFYYKAGPKSLGRECIERDFDPVLESCAANTPDKLRTCCEHIATQIARCFDGKPVTTIMVSGGGAKNTFLVERIQALSKAKITIPTSQIIDFKEALVFAFLGLLRVRGETNCLASVTGASKDSIAGEIHLP